MDACLSACARTNGDGGRSGGGRKKPTLCWPLSLCGRGGSPVFRSLFPPPMRGGWRAERRSVRISPDGPGISRAVTHHTDAPASPDAPFAASVRFRVSRWPATRGLTPASLLRRPLGGEVTTPARKYRIPPHPCDVSRRTPLGGRDGWTMAQPGEQRKNNPRRCPQGSVPRAPDRSCLCFGEVSAACRLKRRGGRACIRAVRAAGAMPPP